MPKHNTRKRKYLLPGKNLIKGKAEVKTLHLADMVICVNGSILRLKGLLLNPVQYCFEVSERLKLVSSLT